MDASQIHKDLINELANAIRSRITQAVISDLQKLRGSNYMLSSDDTYLRNVWEEYCVDQQEGTYYTEVYQQTVESHIESYLEKCTHIFTLKIKYSTK